MSRINILFIGDTVGNQGVETVTQLLPALIEEHSIDFVVANGENSHQGRGINEVIVKRLYKAGVNVITGGDHSFDKHLIFPYMRYDKNLLRPANYPPGVPGFGFCSFPFPEANLNIGVLNLRGQSYFQNPIQCPFRTADKLIPQLAENNKVILVDFHAEATAEKLAFGWFLNDKYPAVTAMIGTHTHVQTADEQLFPNGLAYITDVGFTGAHNTVIGMAKETAINRFLLQTPQKYELGYGNCKLNAALVTVAIETGKALSIKRISALAPNVNVKENEKEAVATEIVATS